MIKNKKAQSDHPLKNYIIYLLLAGLFILALYSFSNTITARYDKSVEVDDNLVNFTGLEETLNNSDEQAEAWQEQVTEDRNFVWQGVILLKSIGQVAKGMIASIAVVIDIVFGAVYKVLGIPKIVTGVILAVLFITLLFAFYRVIKTGE